MRTLREFSTEAFYYSILFNKNVRTSFPYCALGQMFPVYLCFLLFFFSINAFGNITKNCL